MEFEKALVANTTNIPGMLVFDLPVHGDARGWFKENWQREKMGALGLPDMGPVQNNISFNAGRGVTRGIHAEPWDKYISVATGSVFGAWVDLRPGASFGEVYTCVIDPGKAVYVPRGVGNSFQALEDGTAYTYLVNAHWSAELKKTYTFVNLADPALGIEWPIPLSECELSEADKLTVSRARKVQRFLSQPFHVAEQFTGMAGKYVPVRETIRGFKEIVEGKHDDIPESAFLFAGTIDDVVAKAKGGNA